MTSRGSHQPDLQEEPLISNRFLYRTTAVIAVLALVTAGISFGGRWFGQRIALAGHTTSTEEFAISIGQDALRLPANMIRFQPQRKNGESQRVDLYLTWPQMEGYSEDNRQRFNLADETSNLIFVQISQSIMSRDMSGRFEPIYSHLFDGKAQPFDHDLTLHRLRPEAGYGNEVVLAAQTGDGEKYVVRCILPSADQPPGGGDCQRDIHIGQDLSVLYRFSSALLSDWDHIDAAIRSFVETRLITGQANPSEG